MKKNKLYTVNKGLASVLQKQVEPSHLFDDGGYKADDYFNYYMSNLNKPTLEGLVDLSKPVNFAGSLPSFTGKPAIPTTPIIPNTPTSGGFSLSNIGSGVLGAIGGAVGNLAYKGLSGGLSSGAGKAINSVGNLAGSVLSNVPGVGKLAGPAVQIASGIVGGGVNALVGTKVDEEKLSEAKAGTAAYNNFTSSASTMDNIQGPQAQVAVEDAYKGGALKKGWAREKNQAIRSARVDAKNFAFNSVKNNIDTINKDQLNDDLANYVAFGGPLDFGEGALGLMQQNKYLDAINKRSDVLGTKFQGTVPQGTLFADGGATTAFMDDFGSDPIGAAIRYRNSMEQLQAQKEAEAVEAQREQEYLNMQQRLANLETQNQGLQALLGSQANDINTLRSMQPVESFDEGRKEQMMQEAEAIANTAGKYVGDTADKNKVWQYVKKRLKESGRFNDIQIEGIKYNLQRESSINPDAIGDNGTAIGLAQWRGNRQPKDRSLEGQVEHLINTLSTYDGKDHWIGRDNFNGFMNARTPEEAHYYIAKGWERPADSILAKVKNISDMSLRRINAFGGELGTNGTDFTNGLLQVNVGNSHEKNPLGGVPMGVDAEGVPNLVEEGETVFNDYVFSNRMKVPKFMYNELGLGGNLNFKKGKKNKGITFAEASKKLAKESEQRPNDPISAAGLNASLSKLAEIQETERMKKQAEEQTGLNEFALGGKKGKKFAGPGSIPNRLSSIDVGSYGLNLNDPYTQYVISNLPNVTTTTTTGNNKTQKKFRSSNNDFGPSVDAVSGITFTPNPDNILDYKIAEEEKKKEFTPEEIKALNEASGVKDENAYLNNVNTDNVDNPNLNYDPYPTWMRYAPVVGAGMMTLTDALGLTNRPDYSYANRLEAAANSAAFAPNVRFNPIGDYMRNQHFDRMFYANQMQANSNAVNRILRSYSSPSKAANIILNGYNTLNALGNLDRQAEEYDRAVYERTKDFNRKTNMFNSQGDLEAQIANARFNQQAKQFGLSGLAQAAALRDSIDQRVGAARAANLNNFLTSLGNIGRENFALNQINSDRSRNYGVYNNGVSEHKKSSRGKKGSRWF